MRCGRVQRILTAGYDGGTAPAVLARVERHLATCASCRQERARLDRLDGLLGDLASPWPVPAGLADTVSARVRDLDVAGRRHGVRPSWGVSWGRVLVPVAAGAIGVALIVREPSTESGRPPKAVRTAAAPATTATPSRVAAAPRTSPPPNPTRREDVPPRVLEDIDLFVDMPVLRNLEKMKHFDAIAAGDSEGAPGSNTADPRFDG